MPGLTMPRKVIPGVDSRPYHQRIHSGKHMDKRVAISARELVELSIRRPLTEEDALNVQRKTGIDTK